MRFVVIQFSAYLTEFRKTLLQSRYGVALRNLIFVKPDKKLYFLDNLQNEHCLSHPAWSNVSGQPETFPPGEHSHSELRDDQLALYVDEDGDIRVYGMRILYSWIAHAQEQRVGAQLILNGPPPDPPIVTANDTLVQNLNVQYLGGKEASEFALVNHTHPRIVGEMTLWPTDNAPAGWLLCSGQAVGRTTYPALFSLIGTTYGAGNGTTTFNVPDMRGRFPLGQDDMGGSSANRVTAAQADTLGQGAGTETHTLIIGEMPSHNHTVNINGGAGSQGAIQVVGSGVTATPTNTSSTGSGNPHNNMPPYLTLNFIIYAG